MSILLSAAGRRRGVSDLEIIVADETPQAKPQLVQWEDIVGKLYNGVLE
jgi:hypothetical protein